MPAAPIFELQHLKPPNTVHIYIANMLATDLVANPLMSRGLKKYYRYNAHRNIWGTGERVLQAMRITAPRLKFNPLELSKYFEHYIYRFHGSN